MKNYIIYVTSLFLVAVIVPLALQQAQQVQNYRQNAQSAGNKFTTLPPGTTLPSEAECTSRVRRSSWEPRPENQQANNTNPYTQGYRLSGSSLAEYGGNYESRVTGNFSGTTDEIIQWGACKWGFDEDNIRAQAVAESSWKQAALGDCNGGNVQPGLNGCHSVGLLQVKGANIPPTHPGTWPYARTSTAFNIDYSLAIRRACFEGKETWLGNGYKAGDEWGCIGRHFSGDWHDSGAEQYISGVKNHLAQKTWNTYGAGPAPTAGAANPTTPVGGQNPTTTAPTLITPTVYCVGGTGGSPCATLPPTSGAQPTVGLVTQVPSTPPVGGVNPTSSTNPVPSVEPCASESSVMTNNGEKKKQKPSGGFWEAFFQFLLKLIDWLISGGQFPAPNPNPNPNPSPSPAPTGGPQPQPTLSPCPEPTAPASPQPTNQQPTVGPSIGLVSPTLGSQPTTNPTTNNAQLPTQVLNLSNWKLQLPIGQEEKPDEIKQPALATYKNDQYFTVVNGAVRFRAPVNGVTTSGSNYPRSELREMTNNGSVNAAWSPTSGTHTMTIDQAITAVPQTKKHVVAGQIHDGSDDVIVIRLENTKLFVDIGGTDGPTLDANYTLGKRFTVKFEVKNGKTNIYYNGATSPVYTMNSSYTSAYFKAGAYTQSNCSTDAGNCNANNYGEVMIYGLQVTHQ
jgi:hypothetical protein